VAIKWKDWPHVYEMQQLEPSILEKLISHGIAFEKALTEDRQPPRLSRVKRQRTDGSEKPRFIRSLFFQDSTRTEGTFFSAASELEFNIHGVKNPGAFSPYGVKDSKKPSSDTKGESYRLAIMAYTASGGMGYLRGCDGVIIRHPKEGAIKEAIDVISTALGDIMQRQPIFVINAGDGQYGQHPTQAITDLATIWKKRSDGRHFLDDLTVFFPGDIRRSRVIRSLLYAFGHYGSQCRIKVLFSYPDGFGPEPDILQYLVRRHVAYDCIAPNDVADVVPSIDIWYSTRDQREYNQAEATEPKAKPIDHLRECFVFRRQYLAKLREGAFLMHPLPINEDPDDPPPEIDPELFPLAIAGDKRLAFCENSHRHIATRAALLDLIFAGLDELSVTD
jgi:aspartate carbamoyltransferase catalytic subunit